MWNDPKNANLSDNQKSWQVLQQAHLNWAKSIHERGVQKKTVKTLCHNPTLLNAEIQKKLEEMDNNTRTLDHIEDDNDNEENEQLNEELFFLQEPENTYTNNDIFLGGDDIEEDQQHLVPKKSRKLLIRVSSSVLLESTTEGPLVHVSNSRNAVTTFTTHKTALLPPPLPPTKPKLPSSTQQSLVQLLRSCKLKPTTK